MMVDKKQKDAGKAADGIRFDLVDINPDSITKVVYVSNASPAASDANNGLTAGTPVLTLAKASSLLAEGDTLLIERGSVFRYEDVTIGEGLSFLHVDVYGAGPPPQMRNLHIVPTASLAKVSGYDHIYRVRHYYTAGTPARSIPRAFANGKRLGATWATNALTQAQALAYLEANPDNAHWFGYVDAYADGYPAGNYYMYVSLSLAPSNYTIEITNADSQVLWTDVDLIDIRNIDWVAPMSRDGLNFRETRGYFENIRSHNFYHHGMLFRAGYFYRCETRTEEGTGIFFHYLTFDASENDLICEECRAISTLGSGNGYDGHMDDDPENPYPYASARFINCYAEGLLSTGYFCNNAAYTYVENLTVRDINGFSVLRNGEMKGVRGNILMNTESGSLALFTGGDNSIFFLLDDIKITGTSIADAIPLFNRATGTAYGDIVIKNSEFVLQKLGLQSGVGISLIYIQVPINSLTISNTIIATESFTSSNITSGNYSSWLTFDHCYLIGYQNTANSAIGNSVIIKSFADVYKSFQVGDYFENRLYNKDVSMLRIYKGGDFYARSSFVMCNPSLDSNVELRLLTGIDKIQGNYVLGAAAPKHITNSFVNVLSWIDADKRTFRYNNFSFVAENLLNDLIQSFWRVPFNMTAVVLAGDNGALYRFNVANGEYVKLETGRTVNFTTVSVFNKTNADFHLLIGTSAGNIVRAVKSASGLPLTFADIILTGVNRVNKIRHVSLADSTTYISILAICTNYNLMRSTDAGLTWSSVVLPRYANNLRPNLIAIEYNRNTGEVIILLDVDIYEPNALYSPDGGINWGLRRIDTTFKPTQIAWNEFQTFAQSRSGWYVGSDLNSFAYSYDGISWKQYSVR
ncbi:hypothetical protein [Sphingobacterium paludis]|nr:hypothetical protein [Sphingobacterium paludis]